MRDGEGASKFITVRVSGAVSDESAHRVGLAIANSPLVKTAIAGEDANWGRVVMAVGKAGEPADRDTLSIAFGGALRDAITTLATNGIFGETADPVTTGYSFVYHTEIGLLFFTLMILGPLVRTGRNARHTTKEEAARIGLADFPT